MGVRAEGLPPTSGPCSCSQWNGGLLSIKLSEGYRKIPQNLWWYLWSDPKWEYPLNGAQNIIRVAPWYALSE